MKLWYYYSIIISLTCSWVISINYYQAFTYDVEPFKWSWTGWYPVIEVTQQQVNLIKYLSFKALLPLSVTSDIKNYEIVELIISKLLTSDFVF